MNLATPSPHFQVIFQHFVMTIREAHASQSPIDKQGLLSLLPDSTLFLLEYCLLHTRVTLPGL